MARLYSDENFSHRVVEELRRLGHDVLTVQAAGKANRSIPNNAVLEFAASLSRAVITTDRHDYIRLHRLNPAHSGIIVCTYDPDPAGQAYRLHQILEANPELTGQLLRVNRLQR